MSELKVNADAAISQGKYANIVSVTAQERDISIDFISAVNISGQFQGQLVARIFLNRFTAKELSQLIQAAEQGWEKRRYGTTQSTSE